MSTCTDVRHLYELVCRRPLASEPNICTAGCTAHIHSLSTYTFRFHWHTRTHRSHVFSGLHLSAVCQLSHQERNETSRNREWTGAAVAARGRIEPRLRSEIRGRGTDARGRSSGPLHSMQVRSAGDTCASHAAGQTGSDAQEERERVPSPRCNCPCESIWL